MATLQDDRPKPGIYPGVPFETYASWPAVNHSFLKWFEYSAEHALEYRLNYPSVSSILSGGPIADDPRVLSESDLRDAVFRWRTEMEVPSCLS